MRAVLDVNVLVSAVIGSGAPAEVLRAWKQGRFELIVSERLLAELAVTLARPKIAGRITSDKAAAFISLLREAGRLTTDARPTPRRSRDPDDDYLIAIAGAARAVLVSGDSDLLDLAEVLPVVSPRDFLAMLD